MFQKTKATIHHWISALIIASSVAGLTTVCSNAGLLRVFEWVAQDQLLRIRPQEPKDERIVIVTIDEADIEYAQTWPMTDQLMAKMFRNIEAQKPRAIGLDIYRDLAVEPGHSELVDVFKTNPNIIGIQKVVSPSIAPPPSLAEQGQVSANDLFQDSDGKIRRGSVFLETDDGGGLQGFAVKMALTYLQQEGIELDVIDEEKFIYVLGKARFIPLSENDGQYRKDDLGGYQILINYRGDLDKFSEISLTDVLENKIPNNFIKDRLVFIGSKAPSLNDNVITPYNNTLQASSDLMPGVVVHANLTSQIISAALQNRPMMLATSKPINWLWMFTWSVVSSMLGTLFIRKRWITIIGIIGSVSVIILVPIALFINGWIAPIFTPLLAFTISGTCSIGYLLWNNLMLSYQKLEDYAHTLEDKVAERTAELAQANDEITALNEQLKEENVRMSAELDVARQIQNMILPKPEELQSIQEIDIAGYMVPADEVGGDYYDVLSADGVITIGIGDVTGHGLESGILMLMTQTTVRTLKEIRESDPVKFLDTLNRTIYQNIQRMDSERGLTLSILNYVDGQASLSGQHEEMIVIRAGGTIERIDTLDLGLPIGLDDDIADFIDQTTVKLEPDDGIVLYSDGIPEAFNADEEQYGVERMCKAISQNWLGSAEEIKQKILDDVYQFIGEQKIFDDITIVVIKQQ